MTDVAGKHPSIYDLHSSRHTSILPDINRTSKFGVSEHVPAVKNLRSFRTVTGHHLAPSRRLCDSDA